MQHCKPVMRSGISNQQALLEVQMMKWNLTVAEDGIPDPSKKAR